MCRFGQSRQWLCLRALQGTFIYFNYKLFNLTKNQEQTCTTQGYPDTDDGTDCSTDEDKTQTLSEECTPSDPYTEWSQWSACTPDCTNVNDAEERTQTRTRQCKPDPIANEDARCDESNDGVVLEETQNCQANICAVCANFADNAFCAERPNTECVDQEENGATRATCQCKTPYK